MLEMAVDVGRFSLIWMDWNERATLNFV